MDRHSLAFFSFYMCAEPFPPFVICLELFNKVKKNILLTYIDKLCKFMPLGGMCAGGYVSKGNQSHVGKGGLKGNDPQA
jgi:hypothetical protein